MVSMDEICGCVRNYFLRDYDNPAQYIHTGTFVIANGSIQALPFLQEGQYYRIVGSRLNDGVYRYGDQTLTLIDETFDGAIWEMCVPRDFITLVGEINAWATKNAEIINSPYQSESYAGYSYTKAIAGTGTLSSDWRQHFSGRLKPYRRLSVL